MKRIVAATVAVAGLGLVAPPASADPGFIAVPGGNIGCEVYDFQARCDIKEYSFTPPPKPADCPLNWGNALVVNQDQPGQFACHIDSAFGDGPMLAVGSTQTVGPMSCTNTAAGMQCRNTKTQHGFDLSRHAYRLY
ncbi:hypothetical protein AWC05_21265 [Mycobacterium florentinum]|uniref:Ig-like domain-containing protein n=1 Tax=Mycobacterium florentinum TaxID=292462 RepID=A0A1X1U5H9_MYCFL|nr:DUF6636 domain-containing protein [Mycobacterium florentinum]MCV7410331.1 hypothetical protein [Mycobacterium florentinum]ORV52076.1 hypothetical protein AWC05_21265 [Mycobacterium florentinum]BBX79648.1 hypothetical protein MFLOJ_34350 [Mycobacterium florentinum]